MAKRKTKKFEIPQRKIRTKIAEVATFIAKSGFILEMEVGEILKKNGYKVKINDHFFDYDENKKREIDIIAQKIINGVNVVFIIECKQSLCKDWIFVCSDKEPSKWYSYLKHLPEVDRIKEVGLFDHLHTFDNKIPLAQNYIIRHVSGKRSEANDIHECLKKLPKALVYEAHSSNHGPATKRTLFFPLAIFSGQIFIAEYDSDLLIREVDIVQHGAELDSYAYTYHYNSNIGTAAFSIWDGSKNNVEENNTPVAQTSRTLGSEYLIDFITKRGLTSFLDSVETAIQKIALKLWPIRQ